MVYSGLICCSAKVKEERSEEILLDVPAFKLSAEAHTDERKL